MKIKRILVVAAVLAVMLAVTVSGVVLAATQTWDLDSDSVLVCLHLQFHKGSG